MRLYWGLGRAEGDPALPSLTGKTQLRPWGLSLNDCVSVATSQQASAVTSRANGGRS